MSFQNKVVILFVKRHVSFKTSYLDADRNNQIENVVISRPQSDSESDMVEVINDGTEKETPYVELVEQDLGEQGDQVEELGEENKSLLWCLVKQVRPGMDLSKVVLPTFILEPRSFLDKLCDSYFHADILSKAVIEDDPFNRIKYIVQWYLSGFYKKPKGLKKPYNPILGEAFRCYWQHRNGTRTYYIAEQVSHHPPVSAFHVTNRQDGFCIDCSILAKSKFYGNSTSAVLEGIASLILLPRDESYTLNTPYAYCKGILMGNLSMELGGKVTINCDNTGYMTELEFKLKPFLGSNESTNLVSGKIRRGKQTIATIQGRWDKEMFIRDLKGGEEILLFGAIEDLKKQRLKRFVVPLEEQLPNESERLWHKVSQAIIEDNQEVATEEKTFIEERQRVDAKSRTNTEWMPEYFELDNQSGTWRYKYADLRPWDTRTDLRQYECNFIIKTMQKVKAIPISRADSIVSHETPITRDNSIKRSSSKLLANKSISQSESDTNISSRQNSVKRSLSKLLPNKSISQSETDTNISSTQNLNTITNQQLIQAIERVNVALDKHTDQLNEISNRMESLQVFPFPQSRVMYSSRLHSSVADNSNATMENSVLKMFIYALFGLICSLVVRLLLK